MILAPYPFNATTNLRRHQQVINEGIALCNRYLDTGGYYAAPIAKARTAQRLYSENETTENLAHLAKSATDSHQVPVQKKWGLQIADPVFWNDLLNQYPQAQALIKNTQTAWARHAAVAHFSVNALLELHTVLDELTSLIPQTLTILNRSLSACEPKAAAAYRQYLLNLQLRVAEQQQMVLESLYYRLYTSLQRGHVYDEAPLVTLVEQFKTQGITLPIPILPSQKEASARNQLPIETIIGLLKQHGSLDLKSVLTDKLKAHENMVLSLHAFKKSWLWIPDALKFNIPKIGFIRSLYFRLVPQARFKYNFLKAKKELLTQLWCAFHVKEPINVTFLFQHETWLQLETLQKALAKEQALYTNTPRHWFDFLFRNSHQFAHQWQALLSAQQQALTLKQLRWLKTFTQSPMPLKRLLEGPDLEQNLLIHKELNQIQARMAEQGFSNSLQEEFQMLKRQIHNQWALNEMDIPVSQVSEFIAHWTSTSTPLKKGLMDNLKKSFTRSSPETIETFSEPLTLKLSDLLSTVSQMISSPLHGEAHLLYIHQLAQLLQIDSAWSTHPNLLENLTDSLDKALLCFEYTMKQSSMQTLKPQERWFEDLENALLAIASCAPELKDYQSRIIQASIFRSECQKGFAHSSQVPNDPTLDESNLELESDMAALIEQQAQTLRTSKQRLHENQLFFDRRCSLTRWSIRLAQLGIDLPPPVTSETNEASLESTEAPKP